jgi:hypothetical protein
VLVRGQPSELVEQALAHHAWSEPVARLGIVHALIFRHAVPKSTSFADCS